MIRGQYPVGLSPQAGSLVPPPDGVRWGYVPSGPANPIVHVPAIRAHAAPRFNGLGAVDDLLPSLPWYVWAGLAVGAWWLYSGKSTRL